MPCCRRKAWCTSLMRRFSSARMQKDHSRTKRPWKRPEGLAALSLPILFLLLGWLSEAFVTVQRDRVRCAVAVVVRVGGECPAVIRWQGEIKRLEILVLGG